MIRSSIYSGSTIVVLCGLAVPTAAAGQGVQELAQVLQAEDSRRFDGPLFEASLNNPEPLVRRITARAIGRIGDWRGTELLIPILLDQDTTVQTEVMFALGLLRDTLAVEAIINRLQANPIIARDPAAAGISALTRIGGPTAGDFIAGVLDGSTLTTVEELDLLIGQALTDAWRLRSDAPVEVLMNYLNDDSEDWRYRTLYSLGRLREPAASQAFLRALGDRSPNVRSVAAATLTQRYASRAGLDPSNIAGLLVPVLNDPDPGVRVMALRSLATFGDPATGPALAVPLDDPVANVRIQAAWALGLIGGDSAAQELVRVFEGSNSYALQREALLGLSRVDSAAFVATASGWTQSGDWRRRAVAAEGWQRIAPGQAAGAPAFLSDSDPRVVAAALEAWSAQVSPPPPEMVAQARRLISTPDLGVEAAAAQVLGELGDPTDVPRLTTMFRGAEEEALPLAAWAAMEALLSIAEASEEGQAQVLATFLGRTRRPDNYLIRMWAEDNWPDAFARWGPAYPTQTDLSLEDYRAVAERFLVNVGEAYPHVFVETESNGVLEVELFGPDAPLTVQRFLALVDRRFFDGMTWQRLIPEVVIQTGDPRLDGSGVAPGVVRDEPNRREFRTRYLGMARSGPDTGSTEWFITLSPLPYLDGNYTAFGRIVGASPGLQRLTEGDRIRSVHR